MKSIGHIALNIIVTFFQAAFAVWAAAGFAMDKLAVGAVVGAGLSAVYNIVVKPLLIAKGWLKA